jgi:CelD/BcsL family acetyltransferase involved in cellulose biosynthesis
MTDLQGLAERSTATAVAGARETLQAGQFRAPPTPTVLARLAQAGEPASAWVRWRSDEEATGWPQLEFALLIEAQPAGSRIVVLSTREPGYDMSRLRIDKRQRDQILRDAGAALTDAIRGEIAAPETLPTSVQGRRLVTTSR